jgi:hypothetical protein
MRLALLIAGSLLSAQQFVDITPATGIQFRHRAGLTSQKYLLESMGSGVALLDFDRDSLLDIFFVNGATLDDPLPPNSLPRKKGPADWHRLYRNLGNLRFADVTEKAGLQGIGYGTGVAVGDFNNDGYPDLYVLEYGGNQLYQNNRDGSFRNITASAHVNTPGWSSSAAFLDIDRDGYLDLAVSRYLDWTFDQNPWCGARRPGYRSYCHPDLFKPIPHVWYRNRGNASFSSSFLPPGKGLGIAFHDFDGDGWLDLFIANDSAPQQLFRNRSGGKFEDVALAAGLAYDADGRVFAGMGIDVADYDNDGWPDVFINALSNQKYALFRNLQGAFEYVTDQTGIGAITARSAGWGARFIDYDNDGWRDLFVGQGHVMDNIELTQPNLRYRQPLLLMRNLKGRFLDVSSSSGDAFAVPRAARGVAFGDLDNDGAIDVVVSTLDGPPVVLRNSGNVNHWLILDLQGVASNRDAIGAIVRVTAGALTQSAIVSTASSYQSSSDRRLHFGLGSSPLASRIEIVWPSGRSDVLTDVEANRIVSVVESSK